MKTSTPATRALTLLILLAASFAPASAAVKGTWWGAFDGMFARPGNLSLDAAVTEDASFTHGGEVVGVDFGQEFSGRVRVGWRTEDESNSYYLSLWSWNGSDSVKKAGGVIPTLSDPFRSANDFADRVSSGADVEALVLDLVLVRRLAGTRKSNWFWAAGLRHALYDQDWDTDYFEPANVTPGPEETARTGVESKGTGITGGIGSSYQWHQRIRTTLRAQTALLRGETDSSYIDVDYASLGPPFDKSAIIRDGVDKVFQQWELEARVVVNVWRTLDVSLGYWLLNWSDATQTDRFADDVQGAPSFIRQSVSFDAWSLGVSYAF